MTFEKPTSPEQKTQKEAPRPRRDEVVKPAPVQQAAKPADPPAEDPYDNIACTD